MKNFIVLLAIILITSGITQAQTEQERTTDEDLGFSFITPDGWTATKKEIGYIMGSSKIDGFMLIYKGEYKTLMKLKKAMNNGIEQEDGSMMVPMYDLTDLGDQGVSGMYKGTINGVEMKGFLMALLPPSKKKAAICLSVSPAENFNQSNMDQLKLLLRSVVFD